MQVKKNIPINDLIFMPNQKELLKGSGQSKIIDFIDHQYDMVNYTKNQCALIQVSSSPQGTQTFGLPASLRRQSGPNKTRKDSYSALVLGNWMIKTYYDFINAKSAPVDNTFIPYMV